MLIGRIKINDLIFQGEKLKEKPSKPEEREGKKCKSDHAVRYKQADNEHRLYSCILCVVTVLFSMQTTASLLRPALPVGRPSLLE